jgi:hypothetical protein
MSIMAKNFYKTFMKVTNLYQTIIFPDFSNRNNALIIRIMSIMSTNGYKTFLKATNF